MNTSIEKKNDNLSLITVFFLVFVPTTILTAVYVLLGLVQETIPSLLLFFALALVILFPFELVVILRASKKEFGNYSLRSAFANQEKPNWTKTLLYVSLLFCFAGC